MAELVQVVASTHMNFTYGGVDPAPPGENYQCSTNPITREEANRLLPHWLEVCGDRWRVSIEPAVSGTRENGGEGRG